ncbi:hypothetical protein N2152v2_003857 [Parachlorella kessleri]
MFARGEDGKGDAAQSTQLPQRWKQAVENMNSALSSFEQLAQALDGALYLDQDEWDKALPTHKYTMAVQVQHQRIQQLEDQLARIQARLADSERGRKAAEQEAQELNAELENNARVFQLHYEELARKEKEITDLQAVVSALSLGGSAEGAGGGFEQGGSDCGGSSPRGRGGIPGQAPSNMGGEPELGALGHSSGLGSLGTGETELGNLLGAAIEFGDLNDGGIGLPGSPLGTGSGAMGDSADEDQEVDELVGAMKELVELEKRTR